MLNFYQINRDVEIQTRDRLVIKALIPCQRTNSTQLFKLLDEVLGYIYIYIYIETLMITINVDTNLFLKTLWRCLFNMAFKILIIKHFKKLNSTTSLLFN